MLSVVEADIARVVEACGCRPVRAKVLLQMCDNNVEKVIKMYKSTQGTCPGFGQSVSQSDSQSTSPQTQYSPTETRSTTPDTVDDVGPIYSEHPSEPELEDADWNFVLPRVPEPAELVNGGSDGSGDFFLEELIGAIQNGESVERVRNYLAFYHNDEKGISHLINQDVEGFPAIFYVVETRKPDLIRAWVKYGGDIECRAGENGVPLLAFAIGIGGSFVHDTRLVVAVLLSLGADISCIPQSYYHPLARDLLEEALELERDFEVASDPGNKSWLTAFAAAKVVKALNFAFTTRSHLHLAGMLNSRSGAERQVARMRNSSDLLGIPFSLIGQVPASISLIDRLIAYLAMPSKKPVVFVFAGPSGHGKTEISQQLGSLLSLDFHSVDCTSINNETDMFGPRAPYQGSKEGSPLNNFVAAHNGQRCVIFLDEFEKTDETVRQTLLIPFQNGTYQDRRDLKQVDCSKTIWIIATNAFDEIIHEFCRQNKAVLEDVARINESVKLVGKLSQEVRKYAITKFGAPLTGRITQFLPFLTFSPCEAACVADKYISGFGREVRKPICMANNENLDRMVGDIVLRVRRGYSLCKSIADLGYLEELGARSVTCEVDSQIRFPMIQSYLKSLDEITEKQGLREYVISTNSDGEIEVAHVPRAKPNNGEVDTPHED